MKPIIEELKRRAIEQKDIDSDEAEALYGFGINNPFLLMAHASEIREHFKGNCISLCSIVNAKSGICPENCRFCAQSAHHSTEAPVYPLLPAEEIIEKARAAKEAGAHFFGIVTSGTSVESEDEWECIYRAVEEA